MNIKEAKIQIKNAMKAYFTKDEYGNYKIPAKAQRPIFLMGPPGIGKTDIMRQVADELGVGFISYSMTHHTRQSALGLPIIKEKEFDGKTYSISEYTMSEIIASVYEMMEEGKVKEGILFLDEINCVSETLTPTMLQFLQYKVFGKHQVPEGWLIVAAGNPTEYNRNAKDFDIVTWDRLKRIDIDVDYAAFKEHAINIDVHPAILTYLDARKENFYKIENTPEGRRFVTARSWVDLSDMIRLYEPLNIPVDEQLTIQYLQDKDIAKDFAIYYDLFNKYKADYAIDDILNGTANNDIKFRAKNAPFDEKLSLLGLLLDTTNHDLKELMEQEDFLSLLLTKLKDIKVSQDVLTAIKNSIEQLNTDLYKEDRRGTLSLIKKVRYDKALSFLKEQQSKNHHFDAIKADYDGLLSSLKADASNLKNKLEHLFQFVEENMEENEMIVLLSDLTSNSYAARFIAKYGLDAYYANNEKLMFYKRQIALNDLI